MIELEDIIEHYGVKGMRWGKTKSQRLEGRAATLNKRAEKNESSRKLGSNSIAKTQRKNAQALQAKADKSSTKQAKPSKEIRKSEAGFAKKANTMESWNAVNAAAEDHFNSQVGTVNKSYAKHKDAKRYEADVTKLTLESYKTGASQIRNKYNTVQYDTVQNPDGSITLTVKKVQHADLLVDPDIQVRFKRDSAGLVVGVSYTIDQMAQSALIVGDILAHYGVKGMKWGKTGAGKSGPSGTTSKPPAGTVRVRQFNTPTGKAAIVTTKGRRKGASEDAVRAKVINQNRKKSGINSLSNKELQDLVTRKNLERQLEGLENAPPTKKGKTVVDDLLATADIATRVAVGAPPKRK